MLDDHIRGLKRDLINYATLVENMIEKSLKGLRSRDRKLLEEIIYVDELQANRIELEIDEKCTNLVAKFEPKAKQLRTLVMALHMNNDLERMADLAVNIAESSLFLITSLNTDTAALAMIRETKEAAVAMLRDSIESFIEEDTGLAHNVCERDSIVDDLRTKVIQSLIPVMKKDPESIEQSLKLIRISGHLERIADLSTNLCEDVVYMVDGRIIKHNIAAQNSLNLNGG